MKRRREVVHQRWGVAVLEPYWRIGVRRCIQGPPQGDCRAGHCGAEVPGRNDRRRDRTNPVIGQLGDIGAGDVGVCDAQVDVVAQ